jgi:hypothetical protein
LALSRSFDGFGNLTAQTATRGTPPQITLPYDQTTNRISGVNALMVENQESGWRAAADSP